MSGANESVAVTPGYRGYVLGLLVLVGVLGWVDRNVFAVLLESIKLDLGFSDTQLGLLGGLAFGLFYATLGLPVAWLADRYNRRNLLALALGTWSLMTALCGLATGFAALFMARVGVGIGEAGATPPSHSLVADYFAPERRAFALGVLSLYIPLGFVLGFLGGGWLNDAFGWRTAFLVVGLPGVAIACWLRFGLREPPRGLSENARDSGVTPTLWHTLSWLWRRPSLRHLPLGGAAFGIGAFAAALWLPAYFMRSFELTSSQAGAWMALAYGIGGGTGVIVGGWLADRIVRRTHDERWYAWGSALAVLASVPFAAAVYVSSDRVVVVMCLLCATWFGHMFLGPVTALVQRLAGLRRRAVAAAYYLFLVNSIASGVGPVAAGIASDRLAASLGQDSLRFALLLIVTAASLWAAAHFVLAARTLREDGEAARLLDVPAPVPAVPVVRGEPS